jgi:hypothetical protein
LDSQGELLDESEVLAPSYRSALQQIKEASDNVKRIEVYNQNGERAGAVEAGYWRRAMSRGK